MVARLSLNSRAPCRIPSGRNTLRWLVDYKTSRHVSPRIEQTPQSGGPVLHAADRGSAFAAGASGGYGSAGQPNGNSQYDALAALAGKIKDPQAQTAVAAEMIRMQQEAAGMPAGFQVMPRAGNR